MALKKDGTERKIQDHNSAYYFKIQNQERIDDVGRTFCNRLKEERSKEFTQETFSQRIGMKLETYQKLEQGVHLERHPFIFRLLAEELHVSTDYLVGLSDHEKPEYEEVVQKIGLSEDALATIERIKNTLLVQDEYYSDNAYIEMINAFLGNTDCFILFFENLYSLIRPLIANYEEEIDTIPDRDIYAKISDLFMKYMSRVAIPCLFGNNKVDPATYLGLPSNELQNPMKRHNYANHGNNHTEN